MLDVHMKGRTKVLIVFANPEAQAHCDLGQKRAIQEAIQLSPHRENISIVVRHATTIHDLRRALLAEEFHIVHISGHGTSQGLILENELGHESVIPQAALADLFDAHSNSIRCILLNACYSISQAKLLLPGIPFTIAMEGPLDDQAAIEFSGGFYDAIGAGRTIDFAYDEGCRAVNLTRADASFSSRIFVQDRNLRLFLLRDKKAPPRGYACFVTQKGRIAIKPTMYQSLQSLLDDLFITYLRDDYKPYTYGSEWLLGSDSSSEDIWRLVVPWSWQFPENKRRPTSIVEPSWGAEKPEAYGIEAGTSWTILHLSEEKITGIASNEQELADFINALSSKRIMKSQAIKVLLRVLYGFVSLHESLEVIQPEEVNTDEYTSLFVLASGPHVDSIDGIALLGEKQNE